jgi:hypothetical protein
VLTDFNWRTELGKYWCSPYSVTAIKSYTFKLIKCSKTDRQTDRQFSTENKVKFDSPPIKLKYLRELL